MDRHMEQEINLAVAEYVATGFTRIKRWKFYAAYEAKRLRESVWRDIKERITDQGGNWNSTRIIETDGEVILVQDGLGSLLRSKI